MATRKSAAAPKRGVSPGRPSKYLDEYPEQARKMCMLGATNEELARVFGVGLTTLNRWIAERLDFRDALKAGRAVADGEVADKLYRRATGFSHPDVHITNYQGVVTITDIVKHYPPDPTSMIFWLKNRRPDLWRDKPPEGAGQTPEEIARAAQLAIAAAMATKREDEEAAK